MDPPEYVIQQTIAQINAAPNENAAIQAALPAFNPLLDTADAVKSALETRVRQFRAVNFPRYTPGMPLPNLPNHWDAHDVMAAAYWGANAPAAVGATPLAAPPPRFGPQPPPRFAPQPGPRTQTRRGPSPGNFRRRNARVQRGGGGGWSRGAADRGWNVPAAGPAQSPPSFTPLARYNMDWMRMLQ